MNPPPMNRESSYSHERFGYQKLNWDSESAFSTYAFSLYATVKQMFGVDPQKTQGLVHIESLRLEMLCFCKS